MFRPGAVVEIETKFGSDEDGSPVRVGAGAGIQRTLLPPAPWGLGLVGLAAARATH